MKKSKPILKISTFKDDVGRWGTVIFWKPIVDFTKVKEEGVLIADLLSHL